ncbi:DWNN domain-containing protein [Phthorimaea operculella]|nr:DWNN domain-containing protein [Phthorimaea operculella]
MSVHYKFKSALDYDTVTFDGLHISVGDLKAAISQQKRIGKTSDFDLQITNAQTKEVYVDDQTLIPKNTSLLVARVPLAQQPKKQWESKDSSAVIKDVAPNKGVADLSRMEGSEQDKINAMISQSTFDYDPSNYQKIRGANQRGVVPANYTCYKCQKKGHWIKDCPIANTAEAVDVKRSTGIPRSFMVPVDGPKAPGAMMTPSGTFAVPAVDREAYIASESATGEEPPSTEPAAPEPTIPDELVCSLCRDLLTDAVMIPCCGNSFCDECIRGALLESEDHECPDCREKEIAPTTLIPNRFLRNSVSSFRNQTGYNRRMPHRPSNPPPQPQPPPVVEPPPQAPINGPTQPRPTDPAVSGITGRGDESDGPPAGLKPPGFEANPNVSRINEQRASTPTIDERRDPLAAQAPPYGGPPPQFRPGLPPPGQQPFNNPAFPRHGPRPPFNERFPPEPFQPPPPGIKDSPTNGVGEDPLEAFNRMIREKEMRAMRREVERRRAISGSRSPRSVRSRSPRSPPPPLRSPPPRGPRSPPPRGPRSPRSPRSPRARPRSRTPSRPRYSRRVHTVSVKLPRRGIRSGSLKVLGCLGSS